MYQLKVASRRGSAFPLKHTKLLWSRDMDASSFVALSTALDHEVPSVVQNLLLSLEREKMTREDLAMQALCGRIVANIGLDPTYRTSWHQLVRHYSQGCDTAEERARLALQRIEATGWMPSQELFMGEIRELLDFQADIDITEFTDLSEGEDMDEGEG